MSESVRVTVQRGVRGAPVSRLDRDRVGHRGDVSLEPIQHIERRRGIDARATPLVE